MNDKHSVLFVCMGNICRSPAAEGVFRKVVADAGRDHEFDIDSAGTIGYHAGNPADSRMRAAASRRGYRLDSRARRLAGGDYRRFGVIVAMDEDNYRDIVAGHPGEGAEVVRMQANLLGPERFRRATDLYFDRHDGQAALAAEIQAQAGPAVPGQPAARPGHRRASRPLPDPRRCH